MEGLLSSTSPQSVPVSLSSRLGLAASTATPNKAARWEV